jgi:hypothetical protein
LHFVSGNKNIANQCLGPYHQISSSNAQLDQFLIHSLRLVQAGGGLSLPGLHTSCLLVTVISVIGKLMAAA